MSRPRVSFVERWILDHNPCYLLSVLFLLAGCYLLLAPGAEPLSGSRLVTLFAVVQSYEFCLVGAAVLIVRKSLFLRDAKQLLLFWALFLGDATFLTEAIAANLPSLALVVAPLSVVLAGCKLWFLGWGLGVRWPVRFWIWALVQTALIAFGPLLIARWHAAGAGEGLSPLLLVSFTQGMLIALFFPVFERRGGTVDGGFWAFLLGCVLGALGLFHVAATAWSFGDALGFLHLAPVLLGGTVAAARTLRRLPERSTASFLLSGLPVVAVVLAGLDPLAGAAVGTTGSPFRFVLIGALFASLYLAWRSRRPLPGYLAGLFHLAAFAGPTPGAILHAGLQPHSGVLLGTLLLCLYSLAFRAPWSVALVLAALLGRSFGPPLGLTGSFAVIQPSGLYLLLTVLRRRGRPAWLRDGLLVLLLVSGWFETIGGWSGPDLYYVAGMQLLFLGWVRYRKHRHLFLLLGAEASYLIRALLPALPGGRAGWGTLLIGGAFLTLVTGFVLSAQRRPAPNPPRDPANAGP